MLQTFTPTENAWLGFLELPVACSPGVALNVKIREGIDGPILYESNHTGLPETLSETFQLLQVFNPADSAHGIKLHKNHVYAFELTAFGGDSDTGLTCAIFPGPADSSYSRGQAYYRYVYDDGSSWLPLPGGGPEDDEDLPFITLVR